MLPSRGSVACPTASIGYPCVYQTVDGGGYPADVPLVPLVPLNLIASTSNSQVSADPKIKDPGDVFEMMAKRNGIKVSTKREVKNESVVVESAAECFEILAKQNGIKVSISDSQDGTPDFHSQLSPNAKVFEAKGNVFDSACKNTFSYYSSESFDVSSRLIAADKKQQNAVQGQESVHNTDVLKMFEVILEEKKEFERKQFQVVQDCIKEHKNSQKEIETLKASKIQLEEKVENLTNELKVLNGKKSDNDSLKERNSLLQSVLEMTKSNLANKEIESKRLQSDLEVQGLELEESIAKSKILENSLQKWTQRYTDLQRVIDSLENSVEKWAEKCTNLQRQNESLENSVQKWVEKYNSLQKQNESLASSVQKWTEKCTSLQRENERLNCTKDFAQPEASVRPSDRPKLQHGNPPVKSSASSMDCLDMITVNDDDVDDTENWTVVSHNKKAKAKAMAFNCSTDKSPPACGMSRRSSSLSDVPHAGHLGTSFNAGCHADNNEVGFVRSECAEAVNVDNDGSRDTGMTCASGKLETTAQSTEFHIPQTETWEAESISPGDVHNVSNGDDNKSCSASRRYSCEDAVSVPEDGIRSVEGTSHVTTSFSRSGLSTDGSATVTAGLANPPSAAPVTACFSKAYTASTPSSSTLNNFPLVAGAATDPLGGHLMGTSDLANLDVLAKQLGFGDSWYQDILRTCPEIQNLVSLPQPSLNPAAVHPTVAPMYLGTNTYGMNHMAAPAVGLTANFSAAVPSSAPSYFYRVPDLWSRPNSTESPVFQKETKPTNVMAGSTSVHCAGNAAKSGQSSFERLMSRLTERFPSKTRRELMDGLKIAKFSYGQLGFRNKTLDEIVHRVSVIIEQKGKDIEAQKTTKSCCICGHAFGKDEKVLDCGHKFHQKCVSEWISREKTCPLCRLQVSLEDFLASSD